MAINELCPRVDVDQEDWEAIGLWMEGARAGCSMEGGLRVHVHTSEKLLRVLLAETTHGMQPCSGSEKHKKRAKKT